MYGHVMSSGGSSTASSLFHARKTKTIVYQEKRFRDLDRLFYVSGFVANAGRRLCVVSVSVQSPCVVLGSFRRRAAVGQSHSTVSCRRLFLGGRISMCGCSPTCRYCPPLSWKHKSLYTVSNAGSTLGHGLRR